MKSNRRRALSVLVFLSGWIAVPAMGQIASSLIKVGDEVDSTGFPGHLVTDISGVTINGIGGYAATIETTSNSFELHHVWGSVDGITPPGILRTATTVDSLVQLTFANRVGMTDTGSLFYEAMGDVGGPLGDFDAAFLDDSAIMVEGDPAPPGPLSGLFWTAALQATKMSANGRMFFVGGVDDTPGGTTSFYGMFSGNPPQPLVVTGMELPGVPAIIDNQSGAYSSSFRVSRDGNEYFTRTSMETTGTGIPSAENECLIMTGTGFFLDGALVQEGHPVPASIGGLPGELWSAFGSTDFAVNEMGEHIFGTDTSASTSQDEIVVVNGQIVLREGQSLGGTLTSTIEAVDINENGDWAVAWKRGSSSLEVVIFNGQVVLADGDQVDSDGDGIVDATFTDLDVVNDDGLYLTERDENGNVTIYMNLDGDNVEGIYRMVVPAPGGAAGDLQIGVTDSPDPQNDVPGDITYKVTVRNNSPAAIDDVVVTSDLDPTLAFNGGASDPIAMHSGGTVTASLGTMPANSVQTYSFVATANTGGTKITTSEVTGSTTDTVPGNNTVISQTDVGANCDLQVVIVDSPDPVVQPGGAITYTVTAFNDGPSPATGVQIEMNLDPTTVFNAGLSSPGASHNSGVVTINIGNLAPDASVNTTVVVNVTAQGVITADASITGNQPDPIPGNNTFIETTLFQLTSDLQITIVDSPDPVIPVGGPITYAVTARNNGPSNASGVVVTVTLDDNTTFVSAQAPAVHDASPTGGVVTAVRGNLNESSSFTFNIVVTTLAEGLVSAEGEVHGGGNETDPSNENNVAVANTLVAADTSRFASGIFSSIDSSPTSDVPGLPGAKFGSGVDLPFRSPNGNLWIVSADTDLATSVDEVIIVGSHCSMNTMVQEGVTILPFGDAVGVIDAPVSINDSGQFAFATNSDAATTADEVIAQWNGLEFIDVAREGQESAGASSDFGAPVSYSTTIHSPNIISDNTVWFQADTDLPDSGLDFFAFQKNGNLTVIQEGVTIPTGQGGGASELWENSDSDALYVDATGSNYIIQGDLEGSTSSDDVAVVNGAVVIQEGFTLAGSGFGSPVLEILAVRMMSNGDWFARGQNSNGRDWVVRNGSVLATTGDPIYAGSTELWSDVAFGDGFFMFAGNNKGDYVVGGATDSGDGAANTVLVLNGDVPISRENDPVDLNGDGVINDGVRVRTYDNDAIILTDDLQVYIVGTLRSFNDSGANSNVGNAYLRINLCGVAGPCGDLDNDKDVDADDFDIFVLAFGKSTCDPEYHICADFDEDGVVTQVDYQNWLLCYRDFTGNPLASVPATAMGDFDRDGDVDLYDYGQFQACNGDSSVPCRARFDFNEDAVITTADAAGFVDLFTGP